MAVRPSLCWKAYPVLSVGAGATSPDPGRPGVYAWSELEGCVLVWNGSVWSSVITLLDLNLLLADGAFMPPRHEVLVGDGEATVFQVEHNLGTRSVAIVVVDEATGCDVDGVTKQRTSDNAVQISFGAPPSTNQYRVLIQA